MSVVQFLWKACWREADKVTRAIQIIAVTGPFVFRTTIGLFGGEWSKDLWPVWIWALLTVAAICLAVFFGVFKRAYHLEFELEPKVLILGPTQLTWPKGEFGKTLKAFRIEIENISTAMVKNCRVRETRLVNSEGQESGMHRHFRLSEETYADPSSHSFKNTFDLQGRGDKEIIDIAQLDETMEDSHVRMLYATTPTAQTLNSIPRKFFPHELTVSVTADNLAIPLEQTYRLAISDDGLLEMEICPKANT